MIVGDHDIVGAVGVDGIAERPGTAAVGTNIGQPVAADDRAVIALGVPMDQDATIAAILHAIVAERLAVPSTA